MPGTSTLVDLTTTFALAARQAVTRLGDRVLEIGHRPGATSGG
jgi:hypothetical protein